MDNEPPWTITRMTPPKSSDSGVDPSKPDYLTDECREMNAKSRTCRDLRRGSQYMKEVAHLYLPKYEGEDEQDYKNRLELKSFRNFYGQAVRSIKGKIFSKSPALNDDVPANIREHLKDADLNGNDWTIVTENLFNAALDEGQAWVLCDYHTTAVAEGQQLTLAQERSLGVRPYWVVIPQHRILGVNYKKIGETYSISMFRYFSWVKVSEGEFGDSYAFRIYVVEPDRIRVFQKNDDGAWEKHSDLPNTLGMVPAVPLNLNQTGPFEALPPLEDLAEMNIEHFQIRSDQRRALSVASYPLLATFGMSAKSTVFIGPMQSYNFEDPKGDMKWVESQGIHLRAGREELRDLEEQIKNFALSFETPGMYVTATAANIDSTDAVAPIIGWAYRLRDAINSVLWYHGQWMRLAKGGGTIDVDTSFIKSILTVEALKLLVKSYENGAITRRTFLTRLKEYGLLSERVDVDAENDELEAAAAQAAEDIRRRTEEADRTRRAEDGQQSSEAPPRGAETPSDDQTD